MEGLLGKRVNAVRDDYLTQGRAACKHLVAHEVEGGGQVDSFYVGTAGEDTRIQTAQTGRERDGLESSAGEERSALQDLDLIAQDLLLEVNAAVESAGTEVLQFPRQEGVLEQTAVIEREVPDLAHRSRDSDVNEVLALVETSGRNGRDGLGDDDGAQVLAVGKRPLRDKADRDLVLEDIFSRQIVVGRHEAVVEDEGSFLPFLIILIDAATEESIFADGGDGLRDDHFLQVLAIAEGLMVDAGDACRQFNAHNGLVALERPGSNEPCSFGNDEPRFDRLVGSDKDRVDPQTSVGPVLLVEHDACAVESRAIDALDSLWQNDGGKVLATLESLVADSDHCVCVLPHNDGLGDEQFTGSFGIERHFRRQTVVIDGIMYVLVLRVFGANKISD